MNRRYIKIKGHNNWFLVLVKGEKLPSDYTLDMREKILRSEVYTLHGGYKIDKNDWDKRLILAATTKIDYESLADKYGTIVIRPNGSFMTLLPDTEITDEKFDINFNESYFPINDEQFTEVVICENDKTAEFKWIKYLQERFPNKTISTINFFDLRKEEEVKEIFSKAKYITFSTTFSNFNWYKKLVKCLNDKHIVIGSCNDDEKWGEALQIYDKIDMVNLK